MALRFKLKGYPIVYYDIYFCSERKINDLREVRLEDGLGSQGLTRLLEQDKSTESCRLIHPRGQGRAKIQKTTSFP